MPSQFNTKWVNSPSLLPQIGTECPVCRQGIIQDNTFTSYKKDPQGITYKSVSCKTCKTDWVVSQYPPKKVEVQRRQDTTDIGDFESEAVIPTTSGDLEAIWTEIEAIKKRLNRLADYNQQLAGKTGIKIEPHIEE